MSARILVLEDDESLRLVMTKALSRAGYEVRATASAQTAIDRVVRGEADLLVADVVLGQENFLDRIDEITRARPDFPVIVVSAQTTAATAINAARRGARRYLPKPFDLDDLVAAARSALSGAAEQAPGRAPARGSFGGLVGRSGAMQAVFQAIGRLSGNRLPVLFTGPEGSGRATAARALHEARGGKALAEAGPQRLDRDGLAVFEGAADGVLLRRADRWSARAQESVLEYLEARPDAAVYATGTPDVSGVLERALYDRIAAALVELPPLRIREGDARLLFEAALQRLGANSALSREACAFIDRWPWPGEVLELERAAARLVSEGLGGTVRAQDIQAVLAWNAPPAADGLSGAVEQAASRWFTQGEGEAGRRVQDTVDAALIRAALAHCGGVRRDAAALIGWNRNTLARRIEALGLDV
ncbi:response regulator [Marinicauda algicola]|uniref:response regulator n=1 Tax=Marinicauda algicola TaxID=2029849 RepID=UPI0013051BCC|nr:response regulator [Marinicauda algicola]